MASFRKLSVCILYFQGTIILFYKALFLSYLYFLLEDVLEGLSIHFQVELMPINSLYKHLVHLTSHIGGSNGEFPEETAAAYTCSCREPLKKVQISLKQTIKSLPT